MKCFSAPSPGLHISRTLADAVCGDEQCSNSICMAPVARWLHVSPKGRFVLVTGVPVQNEKELLNVEQTTMPGLYARITEHESGAITALLSSPEAALIKLISA